jgi:hypothetical protein
MPHLSHGEGCTYSASTNRFPRYAATNLAEPLAYSDRGRSGNTGLLCHQARWEGFDKRGTHHLYAVEEQLSSARYANVCTITGPATAVAGPVSRGARLCSIHASPRLLDSSAPA